MKDNEPNFDQKMRKINMSNLKFIEDGLKLKIDDLVIDCVEVVMDVYDSPINEKHIMRVHSKLHHTITSFLNTLKVKL